MFFLIVDNFTSNQILNSFPIDKMVKKHMAGNNELLLNSNSNDNNGKDNEQMAGVSKKSKIRYLLVRNENYEKQLGELLQSLSGFARRTAKLRDAGDIVAETLQSISSAEVLNPR